MSIEKVLYRAQATSTGGREGTSRSSDGILDVKLTTPKELGGNGLPGTNPEQLFSAGYAACFLSALQLIARGEKVYAANCAACHKPDGTGAGPIKALVGSPKVLADDHNVQIQVLLNGQNNGAMPAWKQLSDTELAAVATYTKNAWTNKTGQIVQPKEVLAARGK